MAVLNFISQEKETSMGKGDIRSRKGKIFAHSFGKTRPRNEKKGARKAPVAKA